MSEHLGKQFDRELEPVRSRILQMGGLAETQLLAAIDAFSAGNVEAMQRVIGAGKAIDEAFNAILRQLITDMTENRRATSEALDIIRIARAIERVGDHTANIAKNVIYIVSGVDVRHAGAARKETQQA
ncbi:MAG: hypothetical protein H6942_05775 [Candidatus Accumulibacter sp.]|uniref:phosphate signaling complex PhoU family protein n=1 Tax=Accumulibacter sp. TaxID=2053492 RepID=UPI001D587817|nr:PhoU domain-containing protein [Accumulibacter sp.]MCB1942450.1 hypothetical protein [Accumulibacter sp.]MCP5248037.1 hypothetical protein [Accumulibacter sp.]